MKKILLPLLILSLVLLVITLLAILFIVLPFPDLPEFFYFLIALFIWIISPIGLMFITASFIYFFTQSKFFHLFIWALQIFAGFGWLTIMFWLVVAHTNFFQENIFGLNQKALDTGIISGFLFFIIMLIIVLIQINHTHNLEKKGGENNGCFKKPDKFIGKGKS